MSNAKTCVNCGREVDSNFCQDCGQKTKVLPITWKGLFTELSSRWLGLDNRFVRTFTGMWIRPHVVVSEYLDGNRVKYIGPLSYLVVMSALYIFSFSIFGTSTSEFLEASQENFKPADQSLSQQEFMAQYSQGISQNMRLMVASLIPFISLSLIIFYRGRNFLQNFLVVSYATSQLLWLSIITIGIFVISGEIYMAYGLLLNVLYFVWIIGKMNPSEGKFWTYFKAFLAWVVGYAFFMFAIILLTVIGVVIGVATGQITPPQ